MESLLEPQRQLLCEIVDAVRAAHPDNPQLRVTTGGRTGARVFLHGRQTRELGRRPHADIDELGAQGYLRKIRTDTGNAYYAVTPTAHAERERIGSRQLQGEQAAKRRPMTPAPEAQGEAS
jgi:hypothetical protein